MKLLHYINQLFIVDQDKKQISHTKLWSNVGYLLVCVAFVHQIWDSTASTELYLVFGGLVLGNRTLNKFISRNKDERKGNTEEDR